VKSEEERNSFANWIGVTLFIHIWWDKGHSRIQWILIRDQTSPYFQTFAETSQCDWVPPKIVERPIHPDGCLWLANYADKRARQPWWPNSISAILWNLFESIAYGSWLSFNTVFISNLINGFEEICFLYFYSAFNIRLKSRQMSNGIRFHLPFISLFFFFSFLPWRFYHFSSTVPTLVVAQFPMPSSFHRTYQIVQDSACSSLLPHQNRDFLSQWTPHALYRFHRFAKAGFILIYEALNPCANASNQIEIWHSSRDQATQ
jgi:hypothetical protein